MQPAVVNMPEPLALAYLEHLGELADELRYAMQAIGADALSRFEESVARQQDLCSSMKCLRDKAQGASGRDSAVPGKAETRRDESFDARLRQAGESLEELNRRYAALLQHSSDSVRLFAGLCRSYTEPYKGAALSSNRQRLVCEL